MQPHTRAHEDCCRAETERELVSQKQNRNACAHERRDGEVSASSRRSYMPQREHGNRPAEPSYAEGGGCGRMAG